MGLNPATVRLFFGPAFLAIIFSSARATPNQLLAGLAKSSERFVYTFILTPTTPRISPCRPGKELRTSGRPANGLKVRRGALTYDLYQQYLLFSSRKEAMD
jgi:hypothetical protein